MQTWLTNIIPFIFIIVASFLAILVAFLLKKIFRLPSSYVYVAIYTVVSACTILFSSIFLSWVFPQGKYNSVAILILLFILSIFATIRIRKVFFEEKKKG